MIKQIHNGKLIETDLIVDPSFWERYMTDEWCDSTSKFGQDGLDSTGGKEHVKMFVQRIPESMYDRPFLKLLSKIFKEFDIRPEKFICNFYKVLPGGEMPRHIDKLGNVSILIPITEITGPIYFDDFEFTYDSMIAIDAKQPHGVKSPTKERIVFHIPLLDTKFQDFGCLK